MVIKNNKWSLNGELNVSKHGVVLNELRTLVAY